MKFSRRGLGLQFALAVFLFLVTPATAYALKYGVGGRAQQNSGSNQVGYGTNAQSWVGAKPAGLDSDWVNSIYVFNFQGTHVEAGWYWKQSFSVRPRAFVAYSNDELSYYYEWNAVDTPGVFPQIDLPVGQRASISLSNTTGGDFWWAWFQGKQILLVDSTTITSSYSSVGAERETLNYANKGSWTYVRYLAKSGSDYNWTYWPNSKTWVDYDPTDYRPAFAPLPYNYFTDHVDDANHWVYVDSDNR